jgi:MICOS complex subunit MIC19
LGDSIAPDDATSRSLQVGDVKKRFAQPSLASQLPPCQDLKTKIVECYRKNPTETLKCASEVRDFLDCVNSSRISAIDAKQPAKPA